MEAAKDDLRKASVEHSPYVKTKNGNNFQIDGPKCPAKANIYIKNLLV